MKKEYICEKGIDLNKERHQNMGCSDDFLEALPEKRIKRKAFRGHLEIKPFVVRNYVVHGLWFSSRKAESIETKMFFQEIRIDHQRPILKISFWTRYILLITIFIRS